MRARLLLAFAWFTLPGCSENKMKQSEILEFEDIAMFALNKPVKLVVDSKGLDFDKLSFVEEPSGIISSFRTNYHGKGVIEFFFPRTSIISDKLNNKKDYLNKIADKVINGIGWTEVYGKTGTTRTVTMY